jgi:hypothetical protein
LAIDNSCLATHSGGRVSLISESQEVPTRNSSLSNAAFVNHKLLTTSESIEVNEKEDKVNYNIPIIPSESLFERKDQPSCTSTSSAGHIMVAVVSTAAHSYDDNTNIIEGKIKLFTDANLKPENLGIPHTMKSQYSKELFDQSQSPTPYYSSSIITRNKLNASTSNLFIPVNSPTAPIDNLLDDDPENRAGNLQTYSYQDTDWPLQQPVGFKRTAEFTSEYLHCAFPQTY